MENTFTLTNTNRSAITNCFLWMFLGLGATALSAMGMAATGLCQNLAVVVGLGAVAMIASFVIGFFKNKMSSLMMKVTFGFYSVSMGAFLGTLAMHYSAGSVGMAFMISSMLFLCVFLITKFTNVDFTNMGIMSMIGIVILVIGELVLFFLHVHYMTMIFAAAALTLFLGVTIYDIQRANKILSDDWVNEEDLDKMTIYFALQLHLDFINIFLRVLELLGKKS